MTRPNSKGAHLIYTSIFMREVDLGLNSFSPVVQIQQDLPKTNSIYHSIVIKECNCPLSSLSVPTIWSIDGTKNSCQTSLAFCLGKGSARNIVIAYQS